MANQIIQTDISELQKEWNSGGRPVVAVLGLGFVGAAMAIATASAVDSFGAPVFNVIGIDLPNAHGRRIIGSLNEGVFPFQTKDEELIAYTKRAQENGNFRATEHPEAIAIASTIIVDINLDLDPQAPKLELGAFRNAIKTIASHMMPGALIIVETTVPPGTCERIVVPELEAGLSARGLDKSDFLLAHSYERVMPGPDYLSSIINYWRAYSGYTEQAADACQAFLSKVVNTKEYPLSRLSSTTASETAKIMENSYRAVNIAFLEEWSRYAEASGLDMFEIVDTIRTRPSHSNIRNPGFGVGGYCLPKDPLFAKIAASEILNLPDLDFPFCTLAADLNYNMPMTSIKILETELQGLQEKSILLLGVSYRSGVGDTRHSPSEYFVTECKSRGAEIICHDPMVKHWAEFDMEIPAALPDPSLFDAIVVAVAHDDYQVMDFSEWIGTSSPVVLDANNVLSTGQRNKLKESNVRLFSIGRGDLN